MPVHNSNFKISVRPDLATKLLWILLQATINSLLCQKGQFTLQPCPRRWFVRKIFGYYTPKVKIEKSSLKCLPVQTGGFEEITCPKDRQDGPWLSPCLYPHLYMKSIQMFRHSQTDTQEARFCSSCLWYISFKINETTIQVNRNTDFCHVIWLLYSYNINWPIMDA